MNPNPLFERHFDCPVCGNKFTSMSVRSSAINVMKVESDWHTIYRGSSPLHYLIAVCPSCYYAAPYKNFNEPLADTTARILMTELADSGQNLKHIPNLCGERNERLALLAFDLSIKSARAKALSPGEIAGLVLSMAWTARECGNQDIEARCLVEALKCYTETYTNESGDAKLSGVQLAYIIAELYRRTGNNNEAIVWLQQVLNNKDIKKYPDIEKQARELWSLAREEMRENQ